MKNVWYTPISEVNVVNIGEWIALASALIPWLTAIIVYKTYKNTDTIVTKLETAVRKEQPQSRREDLLKNITECQKVLKREPEKLISESQEIMDSLNLVVDALLYYFRDDNENSADYENLMDNIDKLKKIIDKST